MVYVFVLCDYHQYHGVLVRWRCSCGDTFTCNCPILVLNKVYYYYYYYYLFTRIGLFVYWNWLICLLGLACLFTGTGAFVC